MEIAIIVFLSLAGIAILWAAAFFGRRALKELGTLSEQEPPVPVTDLVAEGPVLGDGLVYLYAHEFVEPYARKPMGPVMRDHAFAPLTGDEVDTEDFARHLIYVMLSELHHTGCVEFKVLPRDPSYLPPFPQKQWELRLRQLGPFPSSPLNDSLAVGIDLARQNRLRARKEQPELTPEDDFFSLEEVLERSVKAMRQELNFWERGTFCSDMRNHVQRALIAQGYLAAPERGTWLDQVRTRRPQVNEAAVAELEEDLRQLRQRLAAFRVKHGFEDVNEDDLPTRVGFTDTDPRLMDASLAHDELPLEECLRATIYEAITAIKQVEPSGEAGL